MERFQMRAPLFPNLAISLRTNGSFLRSSLTHGIETIDFIVLYLPGQLTAHNTRKLDSGLHLSLIMLRAVVNLSQPASGEYTIVYTELISLGDGIFIFSFATLVHQATQDFNHPPMSWGFLRRKVTSKHFFFVKIKLTDCFFRRQLTYFHPEIALFNAKIEQVVD